MHTFSLPSRAFHGRTAQLCIPRAAFNHSFSLLRIRIVNFILQNTATPDLGKGPGVMLSLGLQQGSCPAVGTASPAALPPPGGCRRGCWLPSHLQGPPYLACSQSQPQRSLRQPGRAAQPQELVLIPSEQLSLSRASFFALPQRLQKKSGVILPGREHMGREQTFTNPLCSALLPEKLRDLMKEKVFEATFPLHEVRLSTQVGAWG